MKVLLIEDEILALEKMEGMLLDLDNHIEIIAMTRSIESSLEWFKSNPEPELIISDIQLLDGLCFDIFSTVKPNCPVIFTTAFDQYAIRAFEVLSLDYLLKPVQPDKLMLAIEKFKHLQHQSEPTNFSALLELMKNQTLTYKSRFMVRFGQRIIAIQVQDIAYFFSENKLSFILTTDNKKYPLDQPLHEVEHLLDPKIFFRINRQLIVKFTSIAEMHPYFKGRIKLNLRPEFHEELVVSSERTPDFKRWLEQ